MISGKHINYAVKLLLISLVLGLSPVNTSATGLKDKIESCESCHGKDGVSTDHEMPTIAGASATYIMDSFIAYKEKTRPCEEEKRLSGAKKGEASDMCKEVEALSADDQKKLAEHYAKKPFVRAKQPFDDTLAKKGKAVHDVQCKKCHEDGGSSPDDDAGILAGQWMHYLEEQFEAYMSGKRQMEDKMKKKMDKLSPDDIKALVHYYGSFQ